MLLPPVRKPGSQPAESPDDRDRRDAGAISKRIKENNLRQIEHTQCEANPEKPAGKKDPIHGYTFTLESLPPFRAQPAPPTMCAQPTNKSVKKVHCENNLFETFARSTRYTNVAPTELDGISVICPWCMRHH